MYDERIEKILESNQAMKSLKEVVKTGIIIISPNDEKYLNDPKQLDLNIVTISRQLVIDILTHQDSLTKFEKVLKEENPSIIILFISEVGKYKKNYVIRKKDIINLLRQINISEIPLVETGYKKLTNYVSYDIFLNKYKDTNYDIEVDNNKYSIPIEQIISFMNLSNEEVKKICKNNEIKELYGIPKEHFIYAAYTFFKENDKMEKYMLPDNIIKNYHDIESFKIIDIQALNTHLTIPDTLYKEVELDKQLEQAILKGMPKDATDLEKAIYIYIKMCKLLTYDEEYYTSDQKGEAAKKHMDLKYISSITLENNKVVCFEFNLIYTKLLHKLGINFASNYRGVLTDVELYGQDHVELDFRADKFLINADAVTLIINGDMSRAKLNQPLVGLKCINRNDETKREFTEALTKMYKLIMEQEKDKDIKSLDELLQAYSKVTKNKHNISLDERLSILIETLNKTNMVGVDLITYILELRKILFTENQRRNNIRVTILRNNKPQKKEIISAPCVIFTLNNEDLENNLEQNTYYCYDSNQKLIPITREEIQAGFNDGSLEYIRPSDPRIPGITERKGIKK